MNFDGILKNLKDAFIGGDNQDKEVRPASEDPDGDPADQYANARPASEDPYGDPADQYADARPASEDPYGDPANQ